MNTDRGSVQVEVRAPATFVAADPRAYFDAPRRSATWSDDAEKAYRYELTITWSTGGMGRVNFLMLNPSTADEIKNDPTVARCEGYARAWGFDGLDVTNLFAYRATKPEHMIAQSDPVGPRNDQTISRVAMDDAVTVCAWGTHGKLQDRGPVVLERLRRMGVRLVRLGILNRDFTLSPKHPLYLPAGITAYDHSGEHSNQPVDLAGEWRAEIARRMAALVAFQKKHEAP